MSVSMKTLTIGGTELIVKDYVTPQMYGAKADGTTDDTAAIQAAIDSGGYVVFPKGTYKTTQPITVYSKTAWSMDAENADIVYTGNDFAFKFRALRNSVIQFGTITADNGGCLYFDGTDYSYWSQYNDFYFKVFKAGPSSACVKAEQTSADGCWINEIRWHAGRIQRGLYGFHLVRTTSGHNMSHWDFNEIGIEGDGSNTLGTGFKFESANDGKVIGSFMFNCCRHEGGEINTLISTTGAVTKMNWITQAGFPTNKLNIDSGATDWEIYCPLYDSLRVINGEIRRIDKTYALDGGIRIASGTDLRSILTVGNYYCDSNSSVASLSNCPTSKQFLLKVEDKVGASTHGAANYRYLRYRIIDFDDIEYMCTASSSDRGQTWSFSNWKSRSGWSVIN